MRISGIWKKAHDYYSLNQKYQKSQKGRKNQRQYLQTLEQIYEDYVSIIPTGKDNIIIKNLRKNIVKYALECLDDYCGYLSKLSKKASEQNDLFMAFYAVRQGLLGLRLDKKMGLVKSNSSFLELYSKFQSIINVEIPSDLKDVKMEYACGLLSSKNRFDRTKVLYLLNFLVKFGGAIKENNKVIIDNSLNLEITGFSYRLGHLSNIIGGLERDFKSIERGLQDDFSAFEYIFLCHVCSHGFDTELQILKTRFKLHNKTPTFAVNSIAYTQHNIYFIGSLADFTRESRDRGFALTLEIDSKRTLEFKHLYNQFYDSATGSYLISKEVIQIINSSWVLTIYYDHPTLLHIRRMRSPLLAVTIIPKEQFMEELNKNGIKPQYKIYHITPESNQYFDDIVRSLMNTNSGKRKLYSLLH